jgi:hypothetical protein
MECTSPERIRALEGEHGLWDIRLSEDDSPSFANELDYLGTNCVDRPGIGNAGFRLTSEVSVAGRLAKLTFDDVSFNKPC